MKKKSFIELATAPISSTIYKLLLHTKNVICSFYAFIVFVCVFFDESKLPKNLSLW